jgi:hypothetical protein
VEAKKIINPYNCAICTFQNVDDPKEKCVVCESPAPPEAFKILEKAKIGVFINPFAQVKKPD